MRPVWKPSDKLQNCSLKKIRKWGVVKLQLGGSQKRKSNLQFVITILPEQVDHHGPTLTLSALPRRALMRIKTSPLTPRSTHVHQSIAGMLDWVSGAHTPSNTQQHSAPVSDRQRRQRREGEKKKQKSISQSQRTAQQKCKQQEEKHL